MRTMTKLITGLAVGLFLVQSAEAADWVAAAKKAEPSVVYVQNERSGCTGFVVNSDWKNGMDVIATAAHCFGKDLFADNAVAKVIWKDAKADLMLLEIEDTGRPAIILATKNPETGQEIGSFGYGYSLEKVMFRHAYVSNASMPMPDLEGGPFILIDAAYVHGQSGGPCINVAGEVVSIVQKATNLAGVGIGVEKMRDRIGKYLEKKKP